MKKLAIVLVLSLVLVIVSHPLAANAGSDRFQTGFHEELGAIAARAAVGTALGVLGGVFGSEIGGPRRGFACSRGRYASPYEEAYAREAMRIQREQYNRWIAAERARGALDARNDFSGR